MIAGAFEYVAPDSLAGCVAALDDGARVLAGGTWVLPEMDQALSRPTRLVDLRRAGLRGVTAEEGGLRLGAMTTYADLLADGAVARHAPLLATMAGGITGGWALREQATIGGSAAAARPSSDVPAALVACDARVRISGPDGQRVVPAGAFVTGPMTTALRPGEVLAGFDVPSAAGAGHGYRKLKRGGSSWPIATAAALVRLDDGGTCTAAVLVLGGVAGAPVPVDVGDVLVGTAPDDDAVAAAAALATSAVRDPWDDVLAPASYRVAVAAPVARRALSDAVGDARRTARVEATR